MSKCNTVLLLVYTTMFLFWFKKLQRKKKIICGMKHLPANTPLFSPTILIWTRWDSFTENALNEEYIPNNVWLVRFLRFLDYEAWLKLFRRFLSEVLRLISKEAPSTLLVLVFTLQNHVQFSRWTPDTVQYLRTLRI